MRYKHWSRSGFLDLLTVLTAVVISFATGSAFAQSLSRSHPGNSIQSILNADGTIKAGVRSGSFDARGYSMVPGKNGAPRFVNTAADPNDKYWDPSFTVAGVGGFALATANSGDSILYVGGEFGSAGNVVSNNIAVYHTVSNTWSALDTTSADRGIASPGIVVSILVNGNDVYIGGEFSSAGGVPVNNIVDYNTVSKTWTALGSGVNNGVDSQVWTMISFGGNLYVGGQFTHAGGIAANFIARWDGTSWHALGSGLDDFVYTLAISGGNLYVGGRFMNAGGDTANLIAKWNGTSWSKVGVSKTDLAGTYVYSILASGTSLYVGGSFSTASAITVNGLTKWNGTAWSAVGPGTSGSVTSLLFWGTKLYAFGGFSTAGLITVNNVAVIDTSTNAWTALGTGLNVGTNGVVYLEPSISNGKLYIAGEFSTAGGTSTFGIASWTGTNWSSLGGSTNAPSGRVNALAISGTNIYVGGSFLTAGPGQANNIAVYNTALGTWSYFGTGTTAGVDNTVYAITVLGSNVYVGGRFTHAGGLPANHIAMWDGTKWNTLGTTPNDGVDSYVLALATFGSDLYVGGEFTHAGVTAANYIAKWNGTAWSALGSGVDNYVEAIAAGTSQIYVGGEFVNAGGSSANYIASWNGSNWSALGSPTNGVDNNVYTVATYGDTLYAGGAFQNAGGNPANYLAKWNTHEWTVLGSGVNNTVDAMSIDGTNLYIGGTFTANGLVNSYRVIEWSIADSAFTTLGDGVNATCYAIASSGNDAYFGGTFSTAGGKPSFEFGHYSTTLTAVSGNPPVAGSFALSQNYPNPFNPTTVINYQLSSVGNVTLKVYDILGREVATLVNERQIAGNHTVSFDGSRFASGVYFYRLVTGNKIQTMKMVLVK